MHNAKIKSWLIYTSISIYLIDESFMFFSLFCNLISLFWQHLFAFNSLVWQHLSAFNSLFWQHLFCLNHFLQYPNQENQSNIIKIQTLCKIKKRVILFIQKNMNLTNHGSIFEPLFDFPKWIPVRLFHTIIFIAWHFLCMYMCVLMYVYECYWLKEEVRVVVMMVERWVKGGCFCWIFIGFFWSYTPLLISFINEVLVAYSSSHLRFVIFICNCVVFVKI